MKSFDCIFILSWCVRWDPAANSSTLMFIPTGGEQYLVVGYGVSVVVPALLDPGSARSCCSRPSAASVSFCSRGQFGRNCLYSAAGSSHGGFPSTTSKPGLSRSRTSFFFLWPDVMKKTSGNRLHTGRCRPVDAIDQLSTTRPAVETPRVGCLDLHEQSQLLACALLAWSWFPFFASQL